MNTTARYDLYAFQHGDARIVIGAENYIDALALAFMQCGEGTMPLIFVGQNLRQNEIELLNAMRGTVH